MSFLQPLPNGLALAPDAVGDVNNPAASDQELQQGRWWGRWTVAANLPNGSGNAATGPAYAALRPGDEAFVEAGMNLYRLSDRGTDGGADAVWVVEAPPGVIERWYPAETGTNDGEYRVRTIAGSAAFRFNFTIPLDFDALVSVEIVGWPMAGAAGPGKDIDLFSNYAAIGEDKAAHAESDLATVYDTGVIDQFFALDLSPVFSALTAGDFCGVRIDHQAIGGTIDYLGIRLRYTR